MLFNKKPEVVTAELIPMSSSPTNSDLSGVMAGMGAMHNENQRKFQEQDRLIADLKSELTELQAIVSELAKHLGLEATFVPGHYEIKKTGAVE